MTFCGGLCQSPQDEGSEYDEGEYDEDEGSEQLKTMSILVAHSSVGQKSGMV